VRSWQDKGWAIALHGYDHVYTTRDGGIVPIEQRSEFAGVPLEIQRERIRTGYGILRQNGVKPVIWVAPSHSFDRNTLVALQEETDISIISDGIALFPFEQLGFVWIPQQMWRFRTMPFGVWTICLHPNTISVSQMRAMERFLDNNGSNFVDIYQVRRGIQPRRFLNTVFSFLYWFARRLKTR